MHLSRTDPRFSMMALWQTISVLLVCGLIECNDSMCNVTCTTDFISMLNCSNSDLAGTASCDIVAECRDEEGSVNGSCSIRYPQFWCTMEPEGLNLMMSYDTICNITVTQIDQREGVEAPKNQYLDEIVLYKSVKPKEPFNLRSEKFEGGFNLTWDLAYADHWLEKDLMIRIRLQTKGALNEDSKIYILQQSQQYMVIPSESLLPGRQYVADVQVAVDPDTFQSMWSEWSHSVNWTSESLDSEHQYYLLLLMAVPFVMVVVLLHTGKLRGIKKLYLSHHIPSPHDYFKPLYQTYQGDFKKWVGPVLTFNNFDVLEKSTTLQVLHEKQQSESSEEPTNCRNSQRDISLFSLASQNSSKLYFLGSNSHGVSHSGGHISMDTVTVSGQEGIVADWSGESHRQSLEALLSCKEANQRGAEMADGALGHDGRGNLHGLDCDDWHLQEHDLENIEQISLDSYSSNEQSDDGYPQMGLDLDTIDSGFLESDCSSPSAFDGNEQIETASLDGVGGSHSNYVKQWVAFTAVQVDTHSTEK